LGLSLLFGLFLIEVAEITKVCKTIIRGLRLTESRILLLGRSESIESIGLRLLSWGTESIGLRLVSFGILGVFIAVAFKLKEIN